MSEIENFIYQWEGDQRFVLIYLNDLLQNQMNLDAKLTYKIPFYYKKSWVCYLNPKRNGTTEFAFPRGNELSNHQGILLSKGRKQVMSIEFNCVEDIYNSGIIEIIHEALVLDETTPYKSPKNSAKK